jgi:ribonuclease BN (tRNA processing enzyme)
MRVTVVGSSCSIPRPGRACSSYLIETPQIALLADSGTGACASLIRHRSVESLDAIVISHMHADHFIDVIPMRYALKYGERTSDRRVALYLPPGGDAMLRRLVDAFARESSADFIGEVYDVRIYDPTRPLALGDATLSFSPTSHYVPTYALRVDAAGASAAYSADTAPDDRVAELARDVGLFVCEATLSVEAEEERPRGHLSAREAAALASRANARRLALTHYPASAVPEELLAQARSAFAGETVVVDDGSILTVEPA